MEKEYKALINSLKSSVEFEIPDCKSMSAVKILLLAVFSVSCVICLENANVVRKDKRQLISEIEINKKFKMWWFVNFFTVL